MFIIIAKIKKLKTKFKCLDFEVAEFDSIRSFHSGIGDDYHFIHSKKTKDAIILFNAFVKRDSEKIKHVGLIFSDLMFLHRVNNVKIPNMFNSMFLSQIFKISIYCDNISDDIMKNIDLANNAKYLCDSN